MKCWFLVTLLCLPLTSMGTRGAGVASGGRRSRDEGMQGSSWREAKRSKWAGLSPLSELILFVFICFVLLGEIRKRKPSEGTCINKTTMAVKKSEFFQFSMYFLYLLVKGQHLQYHLHWGNKCFFLLFQSPDTTTHFSSDYKAVTLNWWISLE